MSIVEKFASIEKDFRPNLLKLPNWLAIKLFSYGRKQFLKRLYQDVPKEKANIPETSSVKLWGLEFNCPIFNAAGIFKSGVGYEMTAKQGAGAFLIGTITHNKRYGNIKNNILHPFAAYPNSLAASNWMGLPNDGINSIISKITEIKKQNKCPIGISIASSPDFPEKEGLKFLIEDFQLLEKTQTDFIELNESCPNVNHGKTEPSDILDNHLIYRLERISSIFLKNRKKNLPVILKFSNDTSLELVEAIINLCIELGFDGINFGNTSIDYLFCSEYIIQEEKQLFEYFISNFAGGVSGSPLKEKSLNLCKTATTFLKTKNLNKEFHIIRTGGIFSNEDLQKSKEIGVSLNQWFTGYFHNFGINGHKLYELIIDNSLLHNQ